MAFDMKLKTINDLMLKDLNTRFMASVSYRDSNAEELIRNVGYCQINFLNYLELLVLTSKVLDIRAKVFFHTLNHKLVLEMKKNLLKSSYLYEIKRTNEDIDKRTDELATLLQEMRNNVQDARNASQMDLNNIKEKIRFYDDKRNQYHQQIKTVENQITDNGFTSHLDTKALNQLKDNNHKLKTDLECLKQKLDFYDFEPNENSLKDKIQEMREQLEKFDIK